MIELAALVSTVVIPFGISFVLARTCGIPARWIGAAVVVVPPLIFWAALTGIGVLLVVPVYVGSAVLGDLFGRGTRPQPS